MQITNIPCVWLHTHAHTEFHTSPRISHSPSTICKSSHTLSNSTENTHMCSSLKDLQNKCTCTQANVHALTQRGAIHSASVLSAAKKWGSEKGPYTQNDSAPFPVHFCHTRERPLSGKYIHTEGKMAMVKWITLSYTICPYMTELRSRLLFSADDE